MDYLNNLISKWMPSDSPRVAVDSHPRLSGIMDTINATLAHGPRTRLPAEFYDDRGRAIIDKIGVEEWFSGYRESAEYRTVGIGSLVGDIISCMVGTVQDNRNVGVAGTKNQAGHAPEVMSSGKKMKFTLSGCHDTTLAAILASFGAFDNEKWPPYTSSIALELFKKSAATNGAVSTDIRDLGEQGQAKESVSKLASFWSSWFGSSAPKVQAAGGDITRKTMKELSPEEKRSFDGYYVRLRYNDRPMTIPGCKIPGNHLAGDPTFCTLVSALAMGMHLDITNESQEAFKSIADKFTPKNWKESCQSNLDGPLFPPKEEPAGF